MGRRFFFSNKIWRAIFLFDLVCGWRSLLTFVVAILERLVCGTEAVDVHLSTSAVHGSLARGALWDPGRVLWRCVRDEQIDYCVKTSKPVEQWVGGKENETL